LEFKKKFKKKFSHLTSHAQIASQSDEQLRNMAAEAGAELANPEGANLEQEAQVKARSYSKK
jgi:hypothetical protein